MYVINQGLCLGDWIRLQGSQGIGLHFVNEFFFGGADQLFLVISVTPGHLCCSCVSQMPVSFPASIVCQEHKSLKLFKCLL